LLCSNTIIDNKSSDTSNESNEQKSKLSKVIDEIEQCIYCLYGLVLRKSKMKYLNDHNCRSVFGFKRRDGFTAIESQWFVHIGTIPNIDFFDFKGI
jgi:hypothetical protein